MTQSEFKYTLEQGNLNPTSGIVVMNYNLYPDSNYRVDAIAIGITDNLQQLQQATSIILKIPEAASQTTIVKVDISTTPFRNVDRGIVGGFYMYYILTENQRPIIPALSSGDEHYTTDIIIEPALSKDLSIYSTYNPLIGNAIIDRESVFVQFSDRAQNVLNPRNLGAIVTNTAAPASVQDSNYTDTGWINGRYEGSKLTRTNNHNTDPFLEGGYVEGAYFGKDVDDNYIISASASNLTYNQYFYSGKLQSLRFTVEEVYLKIKAGATLTYYTDAVLGTTVDPGVANVIPKPLAIGDLFIFRDPGTDVFMPEIVEFIAPLYSQDYFPYVYYQYFGSYTEASFQVKRGYSSKITTDIGGIPAGHIIYRIPPTIVYSISQNNIQTVQEGKLLIKGTKEVVHLSKDGLVVGGSSVSYFGE